MSGRARPPDEITPAAFFLEWLPEVVAADAERRARLGQTRASLVFHLESRDGAGAEAFTVHIEAGGVRSESGSVVRPDLEVRLDVETWRQLNRGDLSAPEAALSRRVRLTGDLLLALKLHVILG